MDPAETRHCPPLGEDGATGRRRLWWLALVVALFGAARLATVYTESIHWDEFALFAAVDRVLDSGSFS